MNNVVKFLFRPFFRKYRDLLFRVSTLETAVDCLINGPRWVESEEIGFNGQRHRKIIFRSLLRAFNFDAIVETGTYIGDTTGYMAKISNLPVYTCELNKRFFSLAKMRLQDIPNITFMLSDSRSFLKHMLGTDIANNKIFFYLDAHRYKSFPLREELEIICSGWKNFVIMIDDFLVPEDDGYGYDSYGKGKALSLDAISDVVSKFGLNPFFPALPSSEETGHKRGCVVLVREGEFSEILNNLRLLCKKDF